jgi:hypothetical protein
LEIDSALVQQGHDSLEEFFFDIHELKDQQEGASRCQFTLPKEGHEVRMEFISFPLRNI